LSHHKNRREFVLGSAGLLTAAALPYHFSSPARRSSLAVERPNMALIGCGGNGRRTVGWGKGIANLIALCDVDRAHLEQVNEMHGEGKADLLSDYRDVLERPDIDLVQISTPDHWHAKILIEAMLAGKDAYCEKPLTLTVDEGKLVRKIQKETGRVVQVGTQQRSSFDKFNKALAIIAEGRLGTLKKLTVGIDRGGWSPEIPVADVPETLDWDRWLGPAPKVEYRFLNKKLGKDKKAKEFSNCHRQFRWWYEYSGGKLTDWGAHHVDIAMLGIAAAGQSNDPVSIGGTAEHSTEFKDGAPKLIDRYNTAYKFSLDVRFADSDVVMNITSEADNGILFEGTEGRIFVNRGKLVGKPVEDLKTKPLKDGALEAIYRGMPIEGNDRDAHWANLQHCIDKRTLPISDVHSHMKMLNVCHLAGISCRLGREIKWDQKTESVVGDELAASMLKRPYRAGYEIQMQQSATR